MMAEKKPSLLMQLQNEITPKYAVAWKAIGLGLGVEVGTLDQIDVDYDHRVAEKCTHMLQTWIRHDKNASRAKIFRVVNSSAVKAVMQTRCVTPVATQETSKGVSLVVVVLLALLVVWSLWLLWPSPPRRMSTCYSSSDVTFVDREDEMANLTKGFYNMTDNIGMFGKIGCQLVGYGCHSSTRLIGLTSPPGYGKSGLACYYSRQYEGKDTWALYKEMYGSSDLKDLIRYLLWPVYTERPDILQFLRNSTLQELQEQFVSVIVQQPVDVLVFIDNCDTILFEKKEEFIAIVKSLVSRVPNLRILITSREKMEMKTIDVPPLPTPAAVQLLQEGTNMDRSVALQICGLTGNLPQALVLVRPLVKEYYDGNPQTLLKDLQESQLGPLCYKDRNYNVCAAFSLSYSHLSPKCQHIGQLYSYFPGAFSKADGHRILSYVVDSSDIVECEKILMSISLMTPQIDFQIALKEGQKYPIIVREYFHEKLLKKPSLVKDVAGYFCLVYSENLASLSQMFESNPAETTMKMLADQHNYRHMLKLINQHQITVDTDIFRSLLNNMASLSRTGVGVLFSNEDLNSVHKDIVTVALNSSTPDVELRQTIRALLSNWDYFEPNLPQTLQNLQPYYPELELEVYADFLDKMSSAPFPFKIGGNWTLQYNSSTGARFYCNYTIWMSCYQDMLDFLHWIGDNEILDYLRKNYAEVTQKLNACSTTQCYEDLRQEYKKDNFTVYLIEQTFQYYTSSRSTAVTNIMLLVDRFIFNHKYWARYHYKAVLGEGKEKKENVLGEELQSSFTSLHEQDVYDEVNVQHVVKLMSLILDLNPHHDKDDGDNDDDEASTSTGPDDGGNIQDPLHQENTSETIVNQFRDYLATAHNNPYVTESSFHSDMSAFEMKTGLPEEVISVEDRKRAQKKLRDTCFAHNYVNVRTPPPNSNVTNSFWYRFLCYKQFCSSLGGDAVITKQQEYTMYSMLLRSTNDSSRISINQKILEYHRNMLEIEPFSYVQALFTAATLHPSHESQRYCFEARRVILAHQASPQWNRTLSAHLLLKSSYCRMDTSDNNLFLLLWDILNAGQLMLLDQYSLNAVPPPMADPHTDPSKPINKEVKYVMKNDVTEERITEYLQRRGIACSSEPLMSVVPQHRWVTVLEDFCIYAATKICNLIILLAFVFVAFMLLCSR